MMKIYDPPRKMPFQRLHKAIYKGCGIRTIIPARGRKEQAITTYVENLIGDKNHNPRKGTEGFDTSLTSLVSSVVDKNHNPRKGTEVHLFKF